MTAEDVKYSLDRVTNPKTQSPGAGFFASIKGYDDVAGGKAESLSGVTVVDPLHGQVRADRGPTPPSCMSWRSTSRMSCRRRRSRSTAPISARIRSAPAPSSCRMDARPAPRLRAQPRLLAQGPAASRQDHLRDRPGADRRAAAPAEGRGRHARRRHPAGQVPGGDGRSRAEGARRRGRPAAHRLHHHEHHRWRPSTT